MSAADTAVSLVATSPSDHDFMFRLFSILKIDELQAWSWDERMRETMLRMQFDAHERHFRTNFPGADDALVRLGEEPVGRMIVLRGAEALHLADVALLPEFRGRGIGNGLIRNLQAEAATTGVPVRLNCFQANPAIRLYTRLGFATVADRGTHRLMEWRG